MIRSFRKQLLSIGLSFLLALTASPFDAGAQPPPPPQGAAPLSAADLQSLVAPIALYPDALVAQILGAATFPDQIAAASGWLQQNKNLTGAALTQAVDTQPWDPSVKALTQFPSVLDNLAKNLQLDFRIGRGVSHSGRRCHDGGPGVACQSPSRRQFEIGLADYSRAAVAAGDRDSARQSTDGVRPAVQSCGCLRHAVCNAGI